MKAITIRQPAASLLASGLIDQLAWSVPPTGRAIGSRVAIHAGVHEPDFHDMSQETRAWLAAEEEQGRAPSYYPVSAIVCTAILTGATLLGARMENGDFLASKWLPANADPLLVGRQPIGDYAEGRWIWHFADIIAVNPPAPSKGRQGWWTWHAPAPQARRQEEERFMDWLHIEFAEGTNGNGFPRAS